MKLPLIQQHEGYEIVYLDPSTNILAGKAETAPYVVSLSGGLGSAIAGELANVALGRENIAYWFADVLKEDPDLYRFLHDLMKRWGGRLYWFSSGKRPENIWEQKKLIPNNMMCPCSFDLKTFWYRQFIAAMPQLPTVIIGYKAEEKERQERTCNSYHKALPECQVEYPLTWSQDDRELEDICWEDMGIAPPLLYWLGFDYNNCGGDCCKSGIGGRVLEAICFPHNYQRAVEWEKRMGRSVAYLEGKAFCKRQENGVSVPLSLAQIREEYVPLAREYFAENPQGRITEKELIRVVKRWDRQRQKEAALPPTLWD